jgi:hypothetical protein
MSKNIISPEDAGNLLSKLMSESIPVVAYFVAADGSDCQMHGFVAGISKEGLLIRESKEDTSSFLTVSLATPPSTCLYRETRENLEEDRERLKLEYGESALSLLFPSGARVMLFFTL